MRYLVGLCCFLFLFSSCNQDPWQPLFNGTNLEGWTVKGEDATFEIENGVVIGTNQGRTNTFLATNQAYGDFILELEVWVDPRMNSGIQFRSAQNEKGRVYGYQAEIDPSPRAYSGGIYDEARRDWLYPLSLNPAAQKAFVNNEWTRYRIEAYGSSMRVWVNGICTALLEDDVSPEGFIALQVHGVGSKEEEGRQAKWRNVRIIDADVQKWLKPLPPNLYQLNLVTNTLTEHEKNQGWGWLLDTDQKPMENTNDLQLELTNGVLSTEGEEPFEFLLNHEEIPERFEFSFQYRIGPESEFRIFKRAPSDANEAKFQIVDPALYSREEAAKRPGALFDLKAPQNLSWSGMGERYIKRVGQWNQSRILYSNGRLEHWMNGFKIVEYQNERLKPGFDDRFVLERHKGKIELRNLKIRALP